MRVTGCVLDVVQLILETALVRHVRPIGQVRYLLDDWSDVD